MDLNPLTLWVNLTNGLPQPYALIVFLLIMSIIVLLFLYPLLKMFIIESNLFTRWRLKSEQDHQDLMANQSSVTRFLHQLILAINGLNRLVGGFVAWLVLFMVLVQFLVVVMRYVFAIGSIPLQEGIWYMHGMIFMLGAGYTLLEDSHVRVDIFYRNASPRRKAWVNLLGVLFFILPLCFVTWQLSWAYVENSWAVKETSTEGGGLPYIYLLKTVILLFLALLFTQAISLAARSCLIIQGIQLDALSDKEGVH